MGAGPSPLWYVTRGAGAVTLVFLTITVVLGIVEVRRWRSSGWPRFVIDQLHRNASLIAVALIAVHVLTTVLDGFAPIGLVNAVIPFTGSYRPFWLGLGAVALDLVLVLVISSLMRRRLSRRAWRTIHWTAYACWPVALLHGLGMGTDPKVAWMLILTGACVAAVLVAAGFRLAGAVAMPAAARRAAYTGLAASSVGLVVWLPSGPLAAGWARRAGTPAAQLPPSQRASSRRPQTASSRRATLHPPFTADVAGTVREGNGGDGLTTVELALELSGSQSGMLDVRLSGPPAQDGGVQMTDSAVTLGPKSNPTQYQGQIVTLSGSRIVAAVSDSSNARVRLDINLQIDTSIGRATGAVRAT